MAQRNGKYQTPTLFPALNICHFEGTYGPRAAGATGLTLQTCTSKVPGLTRGTKSANARMLVQQDGVVSTSTSSTDVTVGCKNRAAHHIAHTRTESGISTSLTGMEGGTMAQRRGKSRRWLCHPTADPHLKNSPLETFSPRKNYY